MFTLQAFHVNLFAEHHVEINISWYYDYAIKLV